MQYVNEIVLGFATLCNIKNVLIKLKKIKWPIGGIFNDSWMLFIMKNNMSLNKYLFCISC